jgi:hypothetical protein
MRKALAQFLRSLADHCDSRPMTSADPWEDVIREWLMRRGMTEVTLNQIFDNCIPVSIGSRTPADIKRADEILRAHGWAKTQYRVGSTGERRIGYRPATVSAQRLADLAHRRVASLPSFREEQHAEGGVR